MSVYEVADLTKRDLLIEQQLQAISKKSTPSKEMEDTPPRNLINSVQGDINLKDMAIEEQLQKISRNAIKDVLGWKPTKIKSDVTNEMIQEYQDEIANSFYDDPISGKRLKYVPVSSDIDLETFDPQDTLESRGVNETDVRDGIREMTAQKRAAELLIIQKMEFIQYLKDTVEFKEESRKKGFYSKEFLQKNPDLKALMPEEQYIRYVQEVENEIFALKGRIFELDGEIGVFENMLRDNVRVKSENQAQKDKVSKANYQLLQQKSEELNLLNRGKLNLTRQPNETDEDFRQRVIDAGQVEFDEDAIEQQAGRRAVMKFKDNMKEITRNNILIESMIKSVEPSRLFLYNKFFEAIKTKFKEVYGKSTFKESDYPELINIFDNIIDKVNLSTAKTQVATQVDEPPPYASVVGPSYSSLVAEPASYSSLTSDPYQSSNSSISSESYQEPFFDNRFASSRPTAPISLPNVPTIEQREAAKAKREEETFLRRQRVAQASKYPAQYEYPPDPTPAAEARLADAEAINLAVVALPVIGKAGRPALASSGDNPYDLRREVLVARYRDAYGGSRGYMLTSKNDDGSTAGIGDIFDRLIKKGLIQNRDYYERGGKGLKATEAGLKHEKLPKVAQFGKIMINPYALYYQNTLIITTNGVTHLTGYRNVKVSDDFVSIIMQIMNGENPNHKELQKLDLAEKELYDNVIHLAHLHKKVDHNLAQTRQAMKHRFELLNGEVGAGNNNKMVKKELTDLVHKMAYANMISHHQRNKFIKSL